MSIATSAIILRSELNPWIDICIVPDPYEDLNKVQCLAEKAYNDWFDDDIDEPIGDYIKRKLDKAECNYEIYYASMEDYE